MDLCSKFLLARQIISFFEGTIHHLLIGAVSDQYAGWIAQIYSESRYEKWITRRGHNVTESI
jgi:hypothetical protein